MKIQSNLLETPEERYQRHLKKWTKLGLIYENNYQSSREPIKYIEPYKGLTLKLYPVADSSYHGPTPKRQVASFESIYAWWKSQGRPVVTLYVTWENYFYKKFEGYSKDYNIMRN